MSQANYPYSISLQGLKSRPLPLMDLLIAQQAVLFPLYFFTPLWIVLLNGFCIANVLAIHWQKTWQCPRWLKNAVTLAAIAGVFFSFHKISGRDAGVALIAAMYSLKILELNKTRDANLMLALGFFMMLAGFLFSQKPWIAFYQLIPLLAILNAFIVMQSLQPDQNLRQSIPSLARKLSSYLLLALPIMLLLFVFFPRLAGPIWRMPGMPSSTSGISDTMSPGEFSQLHLSERVALRVKFDQKVPNKAQMYWRTLVLDQYDNLTWTRKGAAIVGEPQFDPKTRQKLDLDNQRVDYTITLEPTSQNYLPTLDSPFKIPDNARMVADSITFFPSKVYDRLRYSASSLPTTSVPPFRREVTLSSELLERYTALPRQGNPRAKHWAMQQRQLFASDQDFINAILHKINQEAFYYTLSPPIMEEDMVDSFWFDFQKGFCEHYAGALVYLARAANIPARVVIGYQGAEENPLADYWIVRDSDAHAWTEIWLADLGWVRVDPTSAIAQHRVELDLLNQVRERDTLFDGSELLSIEDLSLLSKAGFWLDGFNNRWNDWVLDYNRRSQQSLMERWGLSHISPSQIFSFVIAGLALFVVLLSLVSFYHRPHHSPVTRSFLRLQKKLAGQEADLLDLSEGPEQIRQQLTKLDSEKYRPMVVLLNEYIKLRYQSEQCDPKALKLLVNKLNRAISHL